MVYDIDLDHIFDNIKLNRQGQYIISNENLHSFVDEYVVGEDYNDIQRYVSNFCVFQAIKLYQDRYVDFEINLNNKYQMYLQLAHVIIMDIIECSEMTEDRDAENTDDENNKNEIKEKRENFFIDFDLIIVKKKFITLKFD